MTAYEKKKTEMQERARIRKEKETKEFLSSVNVVINHADGIGTPIVGIVKETEKCYLDYYIVKHPMCMSYKLNMKRKEYPFDIYYSKEFYKNQIPEKYKTVFEELEQYFNK